VISIGCSAMTVVERRMAAPGRPAVPRPSRRRIMHCATARAVRAGRCRLTGQSSTRPCRWHFGQDARPSAPPLNGLDMEQDPLRVYVGLFMDRRR